MLNWIEYRDAVDFDGSWLRKVDASTGAGEECGEFDNFWFLGCIEDPSGAFGKCGCGEDIAGAGYGWTSGACEVDVGTTEPGGGSMDKAIGDADIGAECGESAKMEIDWSWADTATAWEWDGSIAIASDEGAEEADTGAHATDELRVRGIWGSQRWLNAGL